MIQPGLQKTEIDRLDVQIDHLKTQNQFLIPYHHCLAP